MNIAIIDDVPDEIKEVTALLKEYAVLNHLEIEIDKFSCAEDFLRNYRPLRFTIIFMDIYMNGMTGIEAVEMIRQKDNSSIIIFFTTSEEHRADAFHCHAYDYLIKPVQKESLFRTLDDLLRIKTMTNEPKLIFSSNRRAYSLPYAEIVYIRTESNGSNYLVITDHAGSTYRTRMTFSAVSGMLLQDSRFLLLQSGVLVNLEHIAMLKDKYAVLDNGEQLAFSTRKTKEIRQIWQNFMFDNIRSQSRRK
ncbi:MAG: LytTR family DNA-binding domain-containing protein [Oscillospiraceae bacterium]